MTALSYEYRHYCNGVSSSLILPRRWLATTVRPGGNGRLPINAKDYALMITPSTLWQPFTLGSVELPHRLALAPLTRSRANPDGTPGKWPRSTMVSAPRSG